MANIPLNNQSTYKRRIVQKDVISRETSIEEDGTPEQMQFDEMEQVEGYVNTKMPLKYYFGRDFVTLFQECILEIIKEANLTKNELTLLLYFFGSVEIGGHVTLNLEKIAKDTNLYKSNISLAIKGLVNRKIILKKCVENGGGKKGSSSFYEMSLLYDRLNYNLAWRGKIYLFHEVKNEEPKVTPTGKLPAPPDMFQLAIQEQSLKAETAKLAEQQFLLDEYKKTLAEKQKVINRQIWQASNPETPEDKETEQLN